MALSAQNRLRSPRDFSKVYRKGKRAATKNLAIRALKGNPVKVSVPIEASGKGKDANANLPKEINKSVGGAPSALLLRAPDTVQSSKNQAEKTVRFGISISRKVSKRAVVRNRIKRQIKVILRQQLPNIADSWQIVIVVRPSAVECSFDDFLRELEYLLKKLEIVT